MKKQTRKNLEYLIKNLSTIKIKDLVESLEKNEYMSHINFLPQLLKDLYYL